MNLILPIRASAIGTHFRVRPRTDGSGRSPDFFALGREAAAFGKLNLTDAFATRKTTKNSDFAKINLENFRVRVRIRTYNHTIFAVTVPCPDLNTNLH